MKDKILNILVYLIGAAVLLACLIIGIQNYAELGLWRTAGDCGSVITGHSDSDALTFDLVAKSDILEGVTPTEGDTVLAFDGLKATRAVRDSLFNGPRPVGSTVLVSFRHEGETLESTFILDQPAKGEFFLSAGLITIKYVITIAFLLVAVLALIQQPRSGAARMLILFNFSMAAMIVNSLDLISDSFTSVGLARWKDLAQEVSNFFVPFFGVFWFGLQLLFPRTHPLVKRHPVVAYSLLFLPIIFLMFALSVEWITINYLQLILISYVALGFILLGSNVAKISDPVQKRQAKLVFHGTLTGMVPLFSIIVFFVLVPNILQIIGLRGILIMLLVLFLFMLIVPITYLYAFNRYGLLEIEAKLRRGTRHVLLTGLMLAVLFGVVFGVSELLARGLGVTDRTPVLILSVALAVGVTPAQRRLQGWLDRRFFPERYHLGVLFDEFLQRAATFPDRETLWRTLAHELEVGLGVKKVIPILQMQERGFENQDRNPIPIDEDGDFHRVMLSDGKPILLDEALGSDYIHFSDQERDWLEEEGIELIMPVVASSEIKGILALGVREEMEIYRADEVRILANLARQLALTSENLSLLEENLEKKRLEEQLAVARSIQEGFLPRTIPDTPGLEMAATSLFCLEVAGDYYDVISLPDGKTLFAVGDVSGKGAGAAMIMANLQASLRALIRVEIPLTDLVSGINDLIHHNTPPEDYITFFVGIFDPATSKVTYVNAGHNPPFVFRTTGQRELLEEGGVILGSIPGMPYQQGEVVLHQGDMLLLFTDGVTEAMNEAEEEYGEERLAAVIEKHFSSPAQQILSIVKEGVIEFSGDTQFQDDFTLLVLRRLKDGQPGDGADIKGEV